MPIIGTKLPLLVVTNSRSLGEKFEYVSHGKHRTTRTALSGLGSIQGPKILWEAGQDAGTWPLAGKGIIPLISPADLKKFIENYAIMPLLRRSRFKDRNLG
jgi:hypothetical protein